jgi:predicted CXXCH cytochrome family protein
MPAAEQAAASEGARASDSEAAEAPLSNASEPLPSAGERPATDVKDLLPAAPVRAESRLISPDASAGHPPRQQRGLGADDIAFVDDAGCLDCHAEQAEAWKTSHHALAMQPATESSVLGDFSGKVFEHDGVSSRFFRRDGSFFVETVGPDGTPGEFEIAYTFGVAPLQQYLVPFPGGRLQSLTIAWDAQANRWFDLYPDEHIAPEDALHWTGRYQRWNLMCAECHSTDLRKGYDVATDSYRTTWAEINVGCQACHGPGAEHVAWSRAAEAKSAPDPSWKRASTKGLVAPLRGVEPSVEVEACARCHSRRSRVADHDVHGRPFLDDFIPQTLDAGLYHADGQILDEVYVWGSFVQSRMHRMGVRCGDCHEPHGLGLRAEGDALCAQCHGAAPSPRFPTLEKKRYDTPEHHHHPQADEGARCVSCHMPSRTYMVIDPRRDHSFRVPRPDLSVKLGVPNACADCHADRGNAWAAAAVDEWFGPKRTRGADWAAAIHDGRAASPAAGPELARLAGDLDAPGMARASALRLLPRYGEAALPALLSGLQDDDPLVRAAAAAALAQLRQAEALLALVPALADPVRAVRMEAGRGLAGVRPDLLEPEDRRQLERALQEHEAAQRSMGDMPAAQLNLGVVLAARGDVEGSEAAYRRALEMDPSFVPASANLAQLYAGTGRPAKAEQVLRRAIERTPEEGELHYSLGLLLAEQGRIADSADALEQAARRMPDRPRVHYNLGLARQQEGQHRKAEPALRRAAELDPTDPAYSQALAIFYAQRGRWEEALPHARRFSELTGHAPQAQGLVRRIEGELGR